MLGVEGGDECFKTNVVTDEWLSFLEKKKFPNLNSLCFNWCNITDVSLAGVGGQYSNLRSLNLSDCMNITDTSLREVARRCSTNLQTLDLKSGSYNSPSRITDASVLEVARQCSNLQTLNLGCCSKITDTSVMEVARRCSNLQIGYKIVQDDY